MEERTPTPNPDDITITTMRDDIAAARAQRQEATPQGLARKVEQLRPRQKRFESGAKETKASPVSSPASEPNILNKPENKGGISLPKPKQAPRINTRTRRAILITTLIVTGMLAFAGWGLIIRAISKPSQEAPQEIAAPIAQLIPATAQAHIDYHPTTQEQRDQLTTLWQAAGPAALETVVNADPRTLLAQNDITQWHYILLPNHPMPYLILQKTDAASEITQQLAEKVSITERQGWYILHASDSAAFEQALESGIQQETNTPLSANESAVQLTLYEPLVNKFAQQLFGAGAQPGSLKQITMNLYPEESHLRLEGKAQQAPAQEVVQGTKLLGQVPPDATALHLGANLQESVKNLLTTGFASKERLAHPAVSRLLTQLATPYALYRRTGADNSPDLGMIIEIPPEQAQELALADPGIEEALPALLSIMLGNKNIAPVAFNDATYSDIPLRYANIVGETTALDYAITGTYLVMATSREGIETALDTITKQAPTPQQSLPTTWSPPPMYTSLLSAVVPPQLLAMFMPLKSNARIVITTQLSTENTSNSTGILEFQENP